MIDIDLTAKIHIGDNVLAERLEDSDMHYTSFKGENVSHSCEMMGSDYEAAFCGDNLYLLSANNDGLEFHKIHHGWTYACDRHLALIALKFAVSIEERKLDQAYDRWEDEQRKNEEVEEEDEEVTFNT